MGNAVSPCFCPTETQSVKLIFWGGTTKTLTPGHGTAGRRHRMAGEIMFELPDKMVYHADSFFLGRPLPSLAVEDHLVPGETYFVLPIDVFPSSTLSASSLAALVSLSPHKRSTTTMDFGETGPFEYMKGEDGRVMAKVSPDFIITNIISRGKTNQDDSNYNKGTQVKQSNGVLCSTPELQKQYDQLVGCREQVWSPKLETISEHKVRFSPCRLIGLERKHKEKERTNKRASPSHH